MKNRLAAFPRWGYGIGLLLLFAGVTFAARLAPQPPAVVSAADLTPLSLDGVHRLLVLAPHSDDETLGTGGLIWSALKAGIQVRVVLATNGDGYMAATAEEFRKLYPTAHDYIRMGELRQKESLAALALLGLPAEDVYFLGYPDHGTPLLWEQHWSATNPYTSTHSGVSRSPYAGTYNPLAVYAGEDYLADVMSILDAYRPDLVVYPSPEDVHPDHWGLSVFTRLALTELNHRDPAYLPRQLTYLVHRPGFPEPRGLRPTASLLPPPALYAIDHDWLRLDLQPGAVTAKEQAVQAYRSQLPLLRRLLESFVRTNELFDEVSSMDLPSVAAGDPLNPATWKDAAGKPIPPAEVDPKKDVFSHRTAPATDLVATYAARSASGELWMCAQLDQAAAADLPYAIRLKALTQTGIERFVAHTKPNPGEAAVSRSGDYYCAKTRLADLGNPWALFMGAIVESPDPLYPFDQTAWEMIYVRP